MRASRAASPPAGSICFWVGCGLRGASPLAANATQSYVWPRAPRKTLNGRRRHSEVPLTGGFSNYMSHLQNAVDNPAVDDSVS